MRVIIYGAISETIVPPSIASRLKLKFRQQMYAYRDIKHFKRNKANLIDYRNHDHITATNIGDIAITETITNYFSTNDLNLTIEYCNWNNLQQLNKSNPISASDWIIVPGGGYFMFSKGSEVADRIATDIEIFEASKVNVVLFGVGVNRPDDSSKGDLVISQNSGCFISRLLDLSKLVSVRDLYSKEFLEEYTNRSIELIGDPALHLASQLGITRTSEKDRSSSEKPIIGINFPFHGPTSNRLLVKNIHQYINFLKKLQLATDCDFYYFVHYESGLFIPKLLSSGGIKTTVISGSTVTLLKAYKSLNLHIGGMLHSCIFSHSVGTPAIGLAYDIKHIGFFNLFESPENCISAFDFDADLLLQRSLELLSMPRTPRDNIATRCIELRGLTDDFAARTLKIMRNGESKIENEVFPVACS